MLFVFSVNVLYPVLLCVAVCRPSCLTLGRRLRCAKQVVKGFHALLTNHTLAPGAISRFFTALFKHINVQSLPQGARQHVFDSMELCFQRYKAEILSMGAVFVNGYIEAMDGEKDPRNLLRCFRLTHFVLGEFPEEAVSGLYEEVFDITSCYFPITFSPGKNDPYGITKHDLVAGLRRCLSLNEPASHLVFPLLLEKLESSDSDIKLDCLDTLATCIQSYGPHTQGLLESVDILRERLVKEVLQQTDESVLHATMAVFRALALVMCPDTLAEFQVMHMSFHWEAFMQPLLVQCVAEFSIPDSKLARLHYQILTTILSASANSLARCLPELWEPLRQRFLSTTQDSQRAALVELLHGMLAVTRLPHAACADTNPVAPFAQDMRDMLRQSMAAQSPELRAVAAKTLALLVSLPAVTPLETERSSGGTDDVEMTDTGACSVSLASQPRHSRHLMDAQSAKDTVVAITELFFVSREPSVQTAARSALQGLAHAHPALLTAITLPRLLGSAPLVLDDMKASTDDAQPTSSASLGVHAVSLSAVMECVLALGRSPAVFQELVPAVLQLVEQHFQRESAGMQGSADVISVCLQCIQRILDHYDSLHGPANNDAHTKVSQIMASVAPDVVSKLMRTLVAAVHKLCMRGKDEELDEELLRQCTQLLHRVTCFATQEAQQTLMAALVALFCHGKGPWASNSASNTVSFCPLQLRRISQGLPAAHVQMLSAFTAVIGAARPQVAIPDREAVVNALLALLRTPSSDATTSSSGNSTVDMDKGFTAQCAQVLASLANKLPPRELEEFLAPVLEVLLASAKAEQGAIPRSTATLCIAWVGTRQQGKGMGG